jgi:hypothetical protein
MSVCPFRLKFMVCHVIVMAYPKQNLKIKCGRTTKSVARSFMAYGRLKLFNFEIVFKRFVKFLYIIPIILILHIACHSIFQGVFNFCLQYSAC